MEDKLDIALRLSEEILSGIETETISVSSSALRCLRLARLLSDDGAIEWLRYETAGYPKVVGGIEPHAFSIAGDHGRGDQAGIFVELAEELEAHTKASVAAMGGHTTQGVSVGGEWASVALHNLQEKVAQRTASLHSNITTAQRKISILRGQYYAYAVSVNLELKFSGRVEEVFRSYRLAIDRQLVALAPESLRKLDAAYERLSSENPESWSQALTSCRRVFEDISDALFR